MNNTVKGKSLDGIHLFNGFFVIFRVCHESHYIIDDFFEKVRFRINSANYDGLSFIQINRSNIVDQDYSCQFREMEIRRE